MNPRETGDIFQPKYEDDDGYFRHDGRTSNKSGKV